MTKIHISFKTPDIDLRLKDKTGNEEDFIAAKEILDKYLLYGEYLVIEIDTETGNIQPKKLK